MHDINFIRQNTDLFDAHMKRRKINIVALDILKIDKLRRDSQTELQNLQAIRNEKSKHIGILVASGDKGQVARIANEVSDLKQQLAQLEENEQKLSFQLNEILISLPNILSPDVPDGASEDENILLRVVGEPAKFDFNALEHYELGSDLNMIDFEYAAKLSGSRFVTLSKDIARLERALGNFMIDTHTTKHGYDEYQTPVLVKEKALFGTGQMPKFEEDLFKTTQSHFLIPTAEVTLTNFASDSIFSSRDLPKRLTAWTLCFRSEAGAAGRDTRGMLRQHQFYKVELVSITKPSESDAEHLRMLDCAENILKALELPYRVVTLCSGDTGFGAIKTYDIEVWMPGQNKYREISSCSNCGEFQARRMNAKMRSDTHKKNQYIHTLNGSGVATGRALIAVMENYQQADGSIKIPEVLQPYMGGKKLITKN